MKIEGGEGERNNDPPLPFLVGWLHTKKNSIYACDYIPFISLIKAYFDSDDESDIETEWDFSIN